MTTKINAIDLRAQAEEEVQREAAEKAKKDIKVLLQKKKAAELVVSNIDREIELLMIEINGGPLKPAAVQG